MSRSCCRPTVVTFAAALVAAAALAGDPDLSWLGKLPGLGARVEKDSSSGAAFVYTLTGDPDKTFETVREGFVERGFAVENAADVASAGATSRSFIAAKDGAEAKVNVSAVAGVATLSVEVQGGGAGKAAASPATGAAPASAGSVKVGAALVVNDSHVTRTYQCSGSAITLNGSDCKLTFEGTVSALTVNGSDNVLVLNAKTSAVTVLGSDNVIRWSAKANPGTLAVTTLGDGNKVEKAD